MTLQSQVTSRPKTENSTNLYSISIYYLISFEDIRVSKQKALLIIDLQG